VSGRRKHRRKDPPWTPFESGSLPRADTPGLRRLHENLVGVWLNSRYQVNVYRWDFEGVPGGKMLQLSVKRRDKEVIRDWRDLQRIKNEVCGQECEAVELYPAESRLVDTANQFHIWVLPEGLRFPFGFTDGRLVSERSSLGARQRPWEPDGRPADLMDDEVEEKMRVIMEDE